MSTPPIVAPQQSRMAGFGNQVQGLLSNPLFNIGTGLLAASGPSSQPVGFGQALASGMQFATQRQAEQMKLEQAREEMEAAREQREQAAQRQQAMREFSGLLAPGQTPGPVVSATPAAINTPEGQARAMSLLGQVYPEAFAEQFAAQQFAPPVPVEPPRVSTSVNDFAMMNPDLAPGSAEFRAGYKDFMTQQDPNGSLMDQMQAQLLMMQVENERAERAAAEKTEAQQVRETRRAVSGDLAKLEEMATLNQRLEGTFLEAGMVNPDLRRDVESVKSSLTQFFGGDNARSQQAIADFDRFNKLTQDFVIGSIDRLNGSGALTDAKFNALLSSNASLGSSPQANNLIFADSINAILDGAEIEGIEVGNADGLRALASSLKGAASPVDIESMPVEQLQSLDTSRLTPAQIQRAIQRIQEAGL
jgi:hypothetical protein